jgi:hypothetical protein
MGPRVDGVSYAGPDVDSDDDDKDESTTPSFVLDNDEDRLTTGSDLDSEPPPQPTATSRKRARASVLDNDRDDDDAEGYLKEEEERVQWKGIVAKSFCSGPRWSVFSPQVQDNHVVNDWLLSVLKEDCDPPLSKEEIEIAHRPPSP